MTHWRRVLKSEPDWSVLPADVPLAIRTLMQRCLVKDRRHRVADIAVAQFVLAEASALVPAGTGGSKEQDPLHVQREVEAAVARARRELMWRRVIPAAALLMATMFGLGAWIRRPTTRPPSVLRFSLPLPEGQTFTATGRRAIAIPPDGAAVAFFSDGFLKQLAVGGGASVTICPASALPYGLAWDSSGLVFGQASMGIFRCSANGGSPERLATVNEGEIADGPQMLPGGEAMLFTVAKASDGIDRWERAQVVVQSLTSGTRKTLIEGGSDARYYAGHLLYAFGGDVFAARFDLARLAVVGGRVPVLQGVRRSLSAISGMAHLDLSNTGTLVYIPGPSGTNITARRVVKADRAGVVTRLGPRAASYVTVRATRDGARLALESDDAKEADVWIYELDGKSDVRRLTFGGKNRFPIWSADGQRVAYQSDREGDLAIFSQRVDGTGLERLTRPGPDEAHVPESWSPDSKHMAALSAASTSEIRVVLDWMEELKRLVPAN